MEQREAFTNRLLKESLKEGMTVLDIGCGAGEVSFLASKVVGKSGRVIGIDISRPLLEMAEQKKQELGYENVTFLNLDIEAIAELGITFDAIIGRRVLMYLPDVPKTLQILQTALKPNGILAFQESDAMGLQFNQTFPLHSQVQDWIWQTVEKEGGNIHIGSQLYGLMIDAGLHVQAYQSENVLQTKETGSDLAWVAQMMQGRLLNQKVVTEEELAIEGLEARLEAERKKNKSAFIRDVTFGILAQKVEENE